MLQIFSTLLYALLVDVGGFIGYYKAGSVSSLIVSQVCSLILFGCVLFMARGSKRALYINSFLSLSLLAFFLVRAVMAQKFMPGGMMSSITFAHLLILLPRMKARVQ